MISLSHRFTLPILRGFLSLIPASLICIFAFVVGCSMMGSSPSAPGQTTAFAFVSNSGSASVSAFAISAKGGLSAISGSPFSAGSGAEFIAFDSVHKVLFVSNQSANTISAFSVNTGTGMLTAVPGSPFPTGARPTAVVADAMGRFVFIANQAANSIGVFSIAVNGALTQVAGSPFPAASPFGLTINPAGTVLYASNFPDSNVSDLNTVSAFSIAPDGRLAPVAGSPFPDANTASGFAATIGILADPSGKFLFAADHMAESVVSFNVNSISGSLSPISALPTPAATCNTSCHHNPLRLAVDPADKFIYWTNVQAGTVSTFNINGGNLAFVAESPVGSHPFGLAFDPSGQFLYAVNKVDNTVSGFSVNSTNGTLSPLSGFPIAEGASAPTDIVIVGKTM